MFNRPLVLCRHTAQWLLPVFVALSIGCRADGDPERKTVSGETASLNSEVILQTVDVRLDGEIFAVTSNHHTNKIVIGNLESGDFLRIVFPTDTGVEAVNFDISSETKRVAFAFQSDGGRKWGGRQSHLVLLQLEPLSVLWVDNKQSYFSPRFSLDGRTLFFLTDLNPVREELTRAEREGILVDPVLASIEWPSTTQVQHLLRRQKLEIHGARQSNCGQSEAVRPLAWAGAGAFEVVTIGDDLGIWLTSGGSAFAEYHCVNGNILTASDPSDVVAELRSNRARFVPFDPDKPWRFIIPSRYTDYLGWTTGLGFVSRNRETGVISAESGTARQALNEFSLTIAKWTPESTAGSDLLVLGRDLQRSRFAVFSQNELMRYFTTDAAEAVSLGKLFDLHELADRKLEVQRRAVIQNYPLKVEDSLER